MVEKEEKEAILEEICPLCIFNIAAMRESRKHLLIAKKNFLQAMKIMVDAELERTEKLMAKKQQKLKKIEVK